MREIRFRIWHKEGKEFVSIQSMGWRFDPQNGQVYVNGMNVTGRVIFQQYTGLQDKNGKDIYEGDITIGEHATYSIWWDGTMAQFRARVEKTKSVLIRHNSFPLWQYVEDEGLCRFEIIGNIYENPELLTKEG